MAGLSKGLGAQLILGINLEADSPRLAAIEGEALLRGIGRSHIEAFEVGNEPSLYAALPWYTLASGRRVAGRRAGYDYRDFARQFGRVAASLGSVPLAGPALGAPSWMRRLRSLLRTTPALQIVTYHRYPLDRCFTAPGSPMYPTIPNLLSATGTTGLAAVIRPFARIARDEGRQFRVDELNSVACSGQPGVSDTFASALWMLDTLFAFARDGATGVNIHTFPSAAYRLFSFSSADGHWSATVQPEYYGLLMFAQAAPPGSQLLRVVTRGDRDLAAWATSTPAGATQVVLINKSATQPAAVTLLAPAATAAATVEQLLAPSIYATTAVTIGGASFAVPTATGTLATAPRASAVDQVGGAYTVDLPAASAALVTVPGTTADDLQSVLR
jgi:hypothetical protein